MIGSISSSYSAFPPRLAELNQTTASKAAVASTASQTGGLVPATTTDPTLETPGITSVTPATQTSATSFGDVLSQAVSGVNATMQTAEVEKAKVMSGETNNLHQAMLSIQEAGVAFSLMTEVRNKMVESYQEIMRMQV